MNKIASFVYWRSFRLIGTMIPLFFFLQKKNTFFVCNFDARSVIQKLFLSIGEIVYVYKRAEKKLLVRRFFLSVLLSLLYVRRHSTRSFVLLAGLVSLLSHFWEKRDGKPREHNDGNDEQKNTAHLKKKDERMNVRKQ